MNTMQQSFNSLTSLLGSTFLQGPYIKPVIPCSHVTLLTPSFQPARSRRYALRLNSRALAYLKPSLCAHSSTSVYCSLSFSQTISPYSAFKAQNSTNSQHNLCEPQLVNTQTKFTTLYVCAIVFVGATIRPRTVPSALWVCCILEPRTSFKASASASILGGVMIDSS